MQRKSLLGSRVYERKAVGIQLLECAREVAHDRWRARDGMGQAASLEGTEGRTHLREVIMVESNEGLPAMAVPVHVQKVEILTTLHS